MKQPTFFATAAAFRRWLAANHAKSAELLVGFRKVDSGRPSMTWPESVDEALCFGWIDGVRRRIDDESYSIRFTPRKPGSNWSAINIAKYRTLAAAGRVAEAGVRAWTHRTDERSGVYAYEQRRTAEFSADELRTFRRNRAAWSYFEAAPPGYRRLMTFWVTSAKKPETRAARLEKLMAACAAGVRLR